VSSLLIQILVAAGIFVAGASAGIKWHAGQDAIAENQRLEQVRIQAAAHRAQERRQSEQTIGALNAQAKRTQAAQVAAAAANDASGRLRDDVADLQRRLPSATLDACRRDAAALGTVFNACRAEYEAMGRDAQGHADDTLTLQQAWPK
jgi:hypothetical protein